MGASKAKVGAVHVVGGQTVLSVDQWHPLARIGAARNFLERNKWSPRIL